MNLKAISIKSERLTPKEFLNLTVIEKTNILNSKIVPPHLGNDTDFGQIEVEYKDPIYQVKHGK